MPNLLKLMLEDNEITHLAFLAEQQLVPLLSYVSVKGNKQVLAGCSRGKDIIEGDRDKMEDYCSKIGKKLSSVLKGGLHK